MPTTREALLSRMMHLYPAVVKVSTQLSSIGGTGMERRRREREKKGKNEEGGREEDGEKRREMGGRGKRMERGEGGRRVRRTEKNRGEGRGEITCHVLPLSHQHIYQLTYP